MATSKLMTSSRGVARDSDLSGSPSSSRSHRPTTSPTNTNHNQHPSTSTSYSKTTNQTTPNFPHPHLISGDDNLTARLHPQMTADGILHNPYSTPPSSDQITLIETPIPFPAPQIDPPNTNNTNNENNNINNHENCGNGGSGKTVEEVWKEIVAGRKEMKEEEEVGSEIMTLEDFLLKSGAVVEGEEGEEEVKIPGGGVFGFAEAGLDPGLGGSGGSSSAFSLLDRVEGAIVGFGNGVEVVGGGGGVRGGKRGRGAVAGLIEPLDKAAQQRQRRMIKNRESAARSRERKQAYQVELESQAVKLEEENEQLLKEKEEMTKERFKQLMEKVIPVVEKRKPPRALRRVRSLQW